MYIDERRSKLEQDARAKTYFTFTESWNLKKQSQPNLTTDTDQTKKTLEVSEW